MTHPDEKAHLEDVDRAIHEAKDAEERLLHLDRRAVDTGRDETLITTSEPDPDAVRRHHFVHEHDKVMHPQPPRYQKKTDAGDS